MRTSEERAADELKDLGTRLYKESGIDARHADRDREALIKHKNWLASFRQTKDIMWAGGIVVMFGGRGSGKTQCAVEVIKDECFKGRRSKYTRARELNNELLDAQGLDSRTGAIKVFTSPYLLVIDEYHERFDTNFGFRNMNLIIDKRYGAMKPTIIIANCKQEAMLAILGPSVVDRVKEGGGLIEFDWPSFR